METEQKTNNAPQTQEQNGNLSLYEVFRSVPENARKPITEGRLKGKTDINPMWRIKALTEQFGPCGIGWRLEVTNKWIEEGDNDTSAAFADVNIYIHDRKSGGWSEPIPGNGGNVFKRKESSGRIFVDDDCFKKAISDAIGSAAKLLGVGADIYWDTDTTKYTSPTQVSGQKGTQKSASGSIIRPVLAPGSPYWNQSIATAMNTSDPVGKIRERIDKKYVISDNDFKRLIEAAGKGQQLVKSAS